MAIMRSYKFKLDLSTDQIELLQHYAGVCRLIYNIALEQRQTWGKQHCINFFSQSSELTKLRAEFDWVRAVNCDCQRQALRDLDTAFRNFFAGRAAYPKYRKRGVNDSFRFLGRDVKTAKINAKWSRACLPKIGWLKFRDTRKIIGSPKTVAVIYDATGWSISFSCEVEHGIPAPKQEVVGIDRGVTTTLVMSTGEMMTMPVGLERVETAKRKAQRVAARRKKGSNRRRRAQARVARLQAKQARIRRDFHHHASLSIAQRFGVAVLEDLKTKNMTSSAKGTLAAPGRGVRQKAGLNRVILNAGWRQFQTILTYKMEERGGLVVTVPAQYTSQTCAACGVVDVRSRKSQARFECVSCGQTAHADVNAAINIERRRNTALLDVEGGGYAPNEASTRKDLSISENLRLIVGGDVNTRTEGYPDV